ncbi:hypothetical protein D3C86_597580 [compost metagenome]
MVGGGLSLSFGWETALGLAVAGKPKRHVFWRAIFTRHRLQILGSLLQYIST